MSLIVTLSRTGSPMPSPEEAGQVAARGGVVETGDDLHRVEITPSDSNDQNDQNGAT